MNPINIALADDHTLFREGMESILSKIPEVTLQLQVENGRQLLDQLPNHSIDLVLLDLEMPVLNGPETCELLRKEHPGISILILTMHNEPRMISHLMELGAHGYLLKDTGREELRKAILQIHEKGFYFTEYVVEAMRQGLLDPKRKKPTLGYEVRLTRRETEVLEQIALELTTAEIVEKLFISPRTVEGHREQLLLKLEAKNTAGLILKAIRHELIKP